MEEEKEMDILCADMAELKADVAVVKRDMVIINNLVDKLDKAIIKISDLSTNINQLVMIHNLRLDNIEKDQKLASSMRQSLKDDLEKQHEKSIGEIKDLLKEMHNDYSSLDKRTKKIEGFFWLITGGSVVIGAIIGFLTDNFFNFFDLRGG